MKLIDISTPKYPNTFTMVDDADFEWLNQWKWGATKKGYVARTQQDSGVKRTVLMHVEIMKPPSGVFVDHRFGNKLDNRRESLRICTRSQNGMNRGPNTGRTLPKGVSWVTRDRVFRASISLNQKNIHIGDFHTPTEAEAAYIEAAKKYFGEFAYQSEPSKRAGGEG